MHIETTADAKKADKLLLTSLEAADALSVCEKTLWQLTAPRGPIVPVRIGRAVRYGRRSLETFIAEREAAT